MKGAHYGVSPLGHAKLETTAATLFGASAGRARQHSRTSVDRSTGGIFLAAGPPSRMWSRGFAPQARTADQRDAFSIARGLSRAEHAETRPRRVPEPRPGPV